MNMTESVQERLKLKRTTLDTWSTKEKLSLASLVLRSGDQNWSCVSRNIRIFAEPNRPPDWFSPKNCAQQYASLLENVETPKRKKRTAGSNEKTEVETPGECIVRKLKTERIEELKKLMVETRNEYLRIKEESNSVITGAADDKLPLLIMQLEDEKKQKELEKEAHIKWLKEREERKLELERAWKPGSRLMNIRRASSMSEPSSEADSPLSEPLNVDVPEETVMTKPTPTSPLLTSLLKSPLTAAQSVSQSTSSILHSVITSPHRGSSPTIASLLSSSPGLPGSFATPPSNVSSNLKDLVSNAIAGSLNEEHKVLPQSPSQGAPTLSMLLELPPSLPGKPLPMLKPQTAAPPPYTEHVGPPPPYSQATEYLQKQRAEQQQQQQLQQQHLQQQAQANATRQQMRIKEEEMKPISTPSEENLTIVTTPPSSSVALPVTPRRGSIKGRRLDLQSNNTEVTETPNIVENSNVKSSPVQDKEAKKILHNTSDHDYVETPVKDREKNSVKADNKTPKKVETDVFEFDEQQEGYDDIIMKDSKMSYLKSNAQRLAMKKEAEANTLKKTDGTLSPVKTIEPKSYLKENEKIASPVKETVTVVSEDPPVVEEVVKPVPVEETVEEVRDEPAKSLSVEETESRRNSRGSVDCKKEATEVEVDVEEEQENLPLTRLSCSEEKQAPVETKKVEEAVPEKQSEPEVLLPEIKVLASEGSLTGDDCNERIKSEGSSDPFEEEKMEEVEDLETVKEEDVTSNLIDPKSEKADLSTTEDEKSNDATTTRTYYKRRATASLSDSVPNSPAPFTEEEKEYKAWKKAVMLVYTRLAGHKFASLFLKPITDDQAPGYSSTVFRPMDLSTIKRNIEVGNIKTTAEFQRDVMLMFLNALMYNGMDHDVYSMAKEMQADGMDHLQILLQATDETTPSRRETRTQQNLDVKTRTVEKVSKTSRPSSDSDKQSGGSPESKSRTNCLSMKNSPASRNRSSLPTERASAPLERRRTLAGGPDRLKKRLKVE